MKEQVERLRTRLSEEAEASGYHLNPDQEHTTSLVEGLVKNGERYGYWACPCRLADGEEERDLDIICPCDYRDQDLVEYGTCYCGLYVSQRVLDGDIPVRPIPERRQAQRDAGEQTGPSSGGTRIWRCRVCGYLCAREGPPEVCPICKAKRERFEEFHP